MNLNFIGKIGKITLLLLCCITMTYAQNKRESEVLILDKKWEFSQVGTDQWRMATVPGTVHQDLIHNKLLPDPFWGINEQRIQWVENEDWHYKTTFFVTEEQWQREGAQLIFEGLDTYADVYLNGSLLLRADNMFIGYTIPVKSVLKKGENRLHVYFHSPIRQTLPQFDSNGFNYPADNDHHEKHLSVFTRKAPYSYGWDWGIRMVTSGIWRPVYLRFYDVATITDYHVKQCSLTDEKAVISNELCIDNISQKTQINVSIHVSLEGEKVKKIEKNVTLLPGQNHIVLPLEIENPKRWMPNGWGNPTLYQFSAQIAYDNQIVAEKKHRIGLRTLQVVNEKDKDGESFYFKVNGKPMFVKGANYIPQDALLPAVSAERYRTLFKDIREANMNMIRVWGGGIYEDDLFYELADENGILIWQDFMFACTPYPSDPTFLNRVAAEADYNILRLRNHASLAMWCGNNEILEALKYWGYAKKYTPEVYQEMWQGYDKLFKGLLPNKVKEHDGDRFYMHSSPYFANWGRPESWGIGDSHNWGIWYGRKPFESSDKDIPRFMSEFGFQSFPEMKTIATFASPEDYAIESEVMNAHQKSTIGNSLIRTYMERDYIVPEKFEDFVYVGLLLQGRGIRYGLESHRRHRPYCMGTMYWQLNDSWPVVSWSSIDYYGNWKALHYEVRRAYAPVLLNPVQENDSLALYLISDRLDTLQQAELSMRVVDFNGKRIGKRISIPLCEILGNSVTCVYRIALNDLLTDEQQKEAYLYTTLKLCSGEELATSVYFFKKPKDLLLPTTQIKCQVKEQTNGRCVMTLTASQLAKDVFIEVPIQGVHFSDNFFNLLPGEKKTIVITSPSIQKDIPLKWNIKHLRQAYQ